MTVRSYLGYVAGLKNLPRGRVKGELERVAQAVAVEQVMDRVIGNLSKGFRQRVGLAQALLGDPEVLVLDEPTVGLDPLQIREVRALVKGLAGKHTVILSTHILPEVAMTCEKVLVVNRGRLVDYDTLEGLIAKHLPGRRVTLEDLAFLEEIYGKLVAGPAEAEPVAAVTEA
jgi:ABC-2 type transport system ATP-binding protein